MEDKKIFDLEPIACEDCERYWDSSCDGHKNEAPCKSFKAALKYDIPQRLKTVEYKVNELRKSDILQIITDIGILIYLIFDIL